MTNVMKESLLKRNIQSLTSIASRHALPEATRRQSNGLQLRPERNTKSQRNSNSEKSRKAAWQMQKSLTKNWPTGFVPKDMGG